MKIWACILYVRFLVHFSSNSGSLGFMKVLVLNVRNLKQQEALFFSPTDGLKGTHPGHGPLSHCH